MNENKNCAQEIRQVKVPQLAPPSTGTSPNWPSPRAKSSNCRYTEVNNLKKDLKIFVNPSIGDTQRACCEKVQAKLWFPNIFSIE